MVRKATESIADTAKTVKDKAEEFGRGAIGKIEENRMSAAGALHNAASSLHKSAAKLPNCPDIAHSAADRVESVARYIRRHSAKRMMTDMKALVRKNPGPSLLVAGALGFMLARALRNNRA